MAHARDAPSNVPLKQVPSLADHQTLVYKLHLDAPRTDVNTLIVGHFRPPAGRQARHLSEGFKVGDDIIFQAGKSDPHNGVAKDSFMRLPSSHWVVGTLMAINNDKNDRRPFTIALTGRKDRKFGDVLAVRLDECNGLEEQFAAVMAPGEHEQRRGRAIGNGEQLRSQPPRNDEQSAEDGSEDLSRTIPGPAPHESRPAAPSRAADSASASNADARETARTGTAGHPPQRPLQQQAPSRKRRASPSSDASSIERGPAKRMRSSEHAAAPSADDDDAAMDVDDRVFADVDTGAIKRLMDKIPGPAQLVNETVPQSRGRLPHVEPPRAIVAPASDAMRASQRPAVVEEAAPLTTATASSAPTVVTVRPIARKPTPGLLSKALSEPREPSQSRRDSDADDTENTKANLTRLIQGHYESGNDLIEALALMIAELHARIADIERTASPTVPIGPVRMRLGAAETLHYILRGHAATFAQVDTEGLFAQILTPRRI